MSMREQQKSSTNFLGGGIFYKLPLLILIVLSLAVSASAVHTSTADLQPEWSPANSNVNYTVTFCKTGGDSVNEVRIYKNYDGSIYYTNFVCDDKQGWEKLYIGTYPACFYVADANSPYYDPIDTDGECQAFTFSATTPQADPQYCNLQWRFETRDVSDYWQYLYDTTSVDDKNPVIIKTLGQPQYTDGTNTWITKNTPITIEAYDEGDCTVSDIDYCEYRYDADGVEVLPWTTIIWDDTLRGDPTHYFYTFNYQEDSRHFLQVRCFDNAGNMATHEQTEYVETVPPVTIKTYSPDAYRNGVREWISTSTDVILDATDPQPHPSDVNATWYRVIPAPNSWCETPETYCRDYPETELYPGEQAERGFQYNQYTGPFQIPESCHYIDFYSVDNLGNRETIMHNGNPQYGTGNWQCAFVDGTPPVLTKTVGEPNIAVDDETFDYWVSQQTPIQLNCQDTGPHPSNNVTIYWSYTVDGGQPITGSYNGQDYNLFFAEDSVHVLDAWCTDAVGNTTAHDIETFRVDGTPPIMTKEMLGIENEDWIGNCPPQSPDENCYVADNNRGGVHISVSDPDPTGFRCNVNNVTCTYELWWNGNVIDSGRFQEEGKDILFTEDSTHTLIVNCQDALGNAMPTDTEEFLVDSTPPETTKTYGTPFYTDSHNDWITTDTPITLTATDAKVGVDETHYRYCLYNPGDNTLERTACTCEGTSFIEYSGTPFTITGESQHCIEFYSTDLLGNTEAWKSQLVFVEDTAPVVTKLVGDPKVACSETDPTGCDYYITQQTPITLNCTDPEPHPVGNVVNNYRYRISNDCAEWGAWSEWQPVAGDILFPQDSCHELEYYCADALGNESETFSEIDIVDTVGPAITKEIMGPRYGDCLPEEEGDICYTNGVTQISVNAVDSEPHPVGEVSCQWGYTLDEQRDVFNGWYTTFPIQFPEETQHNLTIECRDALGNTTIDNETFYVDKTPPVTTKNYGNPFFTQEGKEWITSNTEISFSVEDAGPHKSGIAGTWYKISLVNDNYCENQQICQEATGTGDFIEYTGQSVNIPEQSCHLIEYYSKDNVEKTETVKKQCVYVDNTPPTPLKTVGEPKDIWTPGENGDPESYFYPEETQNCWTDTEGSIECWQATVLTPITMDCNDPLPHPVENEKVCFGVELDGTDKTEQYCGRYGGTMNENFCCLEGTIADFKFMEDSEHNLKYYCADALGNSNEANVDEEKFKIEGTKFEIPLFQKWNLVSVPFKLLSDSPEAVFGETDGVDRVWTYDPAHELCSQDWCVYSPDGDSGNDNLGGITPGWGYWVLEKNEDTGINQPAEWITIGGSLFQTGPTGPLSRTLVQGWNLLGYYGTNWELYDWGDFSFTCGDAFNFPDKFLYGDTVYESLYSLVDTEEGHPKWSSVWSYVNCGNHVDTWLGLNDCPSGGIGQLLGKLYAGRGYWVEMDTIDNYVPATGGDGYCLSGPR
ncbi:MAG: hypothetical protein PHD95_04540 [Candidatus ainarchaeum sp.]|nr:hypothetical protein [Candidatus ainarchaeum sp.]